MRKTRIVFHVKIRPSIILWSPNRARLDIDPGVFYTCLSILSLINIGGSH